MDFGGLEEQTRKLQMSRPPPYFVLKMILYLYHGVGGWVGKVCMWGDAGISSSMLNVGYRD